MNTQELFTKWQGFVSKMNEKGIPVPTMRDPKTKEGSVSLTLVFLSSLWVQLGLLGKVSQAFQGINLDQALQFFYACSALYFGRRWVSKDGTKLDDMASTTQNPPTP
jgi:hypothetical protein